MEEQEKEITRADFKDVQNELPAEEDRVYGYMLYSVVINGEDNMLSVLNTKEWKELCRDIKALAKEKGEQGAMREVFSERNKEGGLYRRIMDFRLRVDYEGIQAFMNTREPVLRSRFCKEYLSPMLLVCMRSGWAFPLWWRAVGYGFSVPPISYDGEHTEGNVRSYNPFPYISVSDMTESDRRAFLWVVEDLYWTLHYRSGDGELWASLWNLCTELEGEVRRFVPYPKEGYKLEEILEHSIQRKVWKEGEEVSVDDLRYDWTFTTEIFFPVVINRLEETIYYAMKYTGQEYTEYISSLSVEEDFNFNRERNNPYSEVMSKGFNWYTDRR